MSIFFVGGCQRAGTSTLHSLLCQDACVNPPLMEAKYLQTLVLSYHLGVADFDSRTRDYFDDPAALRRFHGEVVARFLEIVRARYSSCAHLCFKEPHLTMLFPDVASLVPDARFICIVRDPRDVIASLIRVGERLHAAGVLDGMGQVFHARQIDTMVAYFHNFYNPVLDGNAAAFRERCAFVRYEDLVRDPDGILTVLRSFTGLPLARTNLAVSRPGGNASGNTYDDAWVTPLFGRGISASRVGGFREVLSEPEASRVLEGTAAFRELFGYEA